MPYCSRSIRPARARNSLVTSIDVLKLSTAILVVLPLLLCAEVRAQKRRPPGGGRGAAVVVDERLAALRDAPDFSANLLQRMSRGRTVSVLGARRGSDGVVFYRVGVTRRTSGWVQSEAVVRAAGGGDDARLLRLVKGSAGFDRVERACLFLETFPRSPLRPAVLLLLGEAAEEEAATLTRGAVRRLDAREMAAGGAPVHTYFLNYNGLDRFTRRGVRFRFDPAAKRFLYDGAAWREILRRHPRSPEAAEARKRFGVMKK
ncbi:MAG TPA: SH3 domain-containing protein [Pyrinomonadaceae bacterium]